MEETGSLIRPVQWGEPVAVDDGREGAFLLPVGTVTLLMADLEGSTQLWETRPSEMPELLARLEELVAKEVGDHDGVRPLEQGEGDSFVAAFARASDAVAAAVSIHRGVAATPLRLRLGLHTGEVLRRAKRTYAGPALNRAARLRDAGHGGQVLLSRSTAELVAGRLPDGVALVDLGTHRLRDLERPERIYELRDTGVAGQFPPLRTLDARPHNLPFQRTSLIGRRDVIVTLRRLLADTPLLTLTGAGGAGKTRLALHLAAESLDDYEDGVWLVELAPVNADADVVRSVAAALRVDLSGGGVDQLVAVLAGRSLLLVLDNCEHVIGGAAALADELLSAAPGVRIVATSRAPLGVSGETTFPVPSLDVPGEECDPTVEAVGTYAAAQLFVDRARKVRPDFELDTASVEVVAALVRRLDGIPLAIELAAARTRSLTPRQILDGLQSRFLLLTGGVRTALPRQQTLEASVDWSYGLLTEPERIVFRRLAVFPTTFSLVAAEAVAAATPLEPHQVIDVLSLLVEKSLVQLDPATGRYSLLETIREYAALRLGEAEEQAEVEERHRRYFARLADELRIITMPDHRLGWEPIRTVSDEVDNLEAAATSALRSQDWPALVSIARLTVGSGFENQPRLDHVISAARAAIAAEYESLSDSDRLAGACTLVDFVSGQRLRPDAGALIESALREARSRGDAVNAALLAFAVALLDEATTDDAWTEVFAAGSAVSPRTEAVFRLYRAMRSPDPAQHVELFEEALAVAEASGDALVTAYCHWALATAEGPWAPDRAIERLDTVIAECKRESMPGMLARCLCHLGGALAAAGRLDEAEATLDQAGRLGNLLLDQHRLGNIAIARASVAIERGDVEQAEQHFLEAVDRLAGKPGDRIGAVAWLAGIYLSRGDDERASARVAMALAMDPMPSRGTAISRGHALTYRSLIELRRGDVDRAEATAHEALATGGSMHTFLAVALVAAEMESFEESARLLGAWRALRPSLYLKPYLDERAEELEARLRSHLAIDDLRARLAEGSVLSRQQAVAYARRGRGERKRPSSGWASLTPTEAQVVELVGEGLTNAQVGERLFVSASTVKTHLASIFGKLGLSNRAELAAAFARRQG